MNRFAANEPESSFFVDVFKIALGVFIGSLLAALAYTKIVAWGVEYAAKEAMEKMEKDARAQAEHSRQQAELQRLRREENERAKANAERMVAEARAQHQLRQQEHEEQMKREWQKIYQPTAACRVDSTTMPCVNAYAAAHKRFMDKFGEMPPRF